MTKRPKYRSRNAKALAIRRFTLGFFFALSFVSFGYFEPWNWKNNPLEQWGDQVTVNYNELPNAKGAFRMLDPMPWTNTYYPKRKGGFAIRYDDSETIESEMDDEVTSVQRRYKSRMEKYNKDSVRYRELEEEMDGEVASIELKYYRRLGERALGYELHSNDELARMSESALQNLSAPEKLDIINGFAEDPRSRNYYKNLWKIRNDVDDAVESPNEGANVYSGWCQPLALASVLHPEPDLIRHRVSIQTRSGKKDIVLPLTSSDIKAFLMMAYEDRLDSISEDDSNYKMVDRRCYDKSSKYYKAENCKSMNAGTFHVILLNQIERFKKGFVADFDAKGPVWNHPVVGYEILESNWYTDDDGNYLHSQFASDKSKREREFQVKMYFVKNSIGLHERAMGEANIRGGYLYNRILNYRVELDKDDNILGGTWLSEKKLVDYMWTYPKITKFEDDYQFLNDLLK